MTTAIATLKTNIATDNFTLPTIAAIAIALVFAPIIALAVVSFVSPIICLAIVVIGAILL